MTVPTPTSDQVLELRGKIDEPTTANYSDLALQNILQRYPMLDWKDTEPYMIVNWAPNINPTYDPYWQPTYDLNRAAADVWEEKAAKLAEDTDFSADGSSFSRSQRYQQYMAQARFFRSRRSGRCRPSLGR